MASDPVQTQIEVEGFLFREAALLEENRFHEWLELFTDDIRYFMPVRRNPQPQEEPRRNTTGEEGFSFFNDDKSSLSMRVARIDTGIAHAEAPLSVTQRLITNVRVEPGEKADELVAYSSFMVYQERRGRTGTTFFGKRCDKLRRSAGGLKIADRRIDLAQTLLPTTISIFF